MGCCASKGPDEAARDPTEKMKPAEAGGAPDAQAQGDPHALQQQHPPQAQQHTQPTQHDSYYHRQEIPAGQQQQQQQQQQQHPHPAYRPSGQQAGPQYDSLHQGDVRGLQLPPHPSGNGDVQRRRSSSASRRAMPRFDIGQKVDARWLNGAHYPGWIVSGSSGSGVYRVQYEDGDVEFVKAEHIVSRFGTGDRVEARWKGTDYYRGWVVGPTENGFCPIHFDDGGFEPYEPVDHIRAAAEPSSVSKGPLPPPGARQQLPVPSRRPAAQQHQQQQPSYDRRS